MWNLKKKSNIKTDSRKLVAMEGGVGKIGGGWKRVETFMYKLNNV